MNDIALDLRREIDQYVSAKDAIELAYGREILKEIDLTKDDTTLNLVLEFPLFPYLTEM